MQHHFAAAAEHHLKWRHHYRLRRVAQAHDGALEESTDQVELFPVFVLRFHQHQHDVRAHTEVWALVTNYQANEILFHFAEGKLQHLESVATDGVHLRMKLQARDSITKVDQRC